MKSILLLFARAARERGQRHAVRQQQRSGGVRRVARPRRAADREPRDAVRRARRAHADGDERPVARDPPGNRRDDAVRDPQHQRGDLSFRPGGGVQQASGTDRRPAGNRARLSALGRASLFARVHGS